MSDRKVQETLIESPGFLLQELGMETVGLYRRHTREWQWISVDQLDREIWQNGEALVLRHLDDGRSAIIRFSHSLSLSFLCHQGPGYALVTVRPDYVGEGRKFLVSLRDEAMGGHTYQPVRVLSRLKRLPFSEADVVFPWLP